MKKGVIMNECKCLRCGYKWTPRVKEPKACPACLSRLWMKERGIK